MTRRVKTLKTKFKQAKYVMDEIEQILIEMEKNHECADLGLLFDIESMNGKLSMLCRENSRRITNVQQNKPEDARKQAFSMWCNKRNFPVIW